MYVRRVALDWRHYRDDKRYAHRCGKKQKKKERKIDYVTLVRANSSEHNGCTARLVLSPGLYDFAVESVACGTRARGPTQCNEPRRGGRRGETAGSLIVIRGRCPFESIQRVRYADRHPTLRAPSRYQLRAGARPAEIIAAPYAGSPKIKFLRHEKCRPRVMGQASRAKSRPSRFTRADCFFGVLLL